MDRRSFLASAISSVASAVGIGGGVPEQPPLREVGGETLQQESCDSCVKLEEFKQDVLHKQVPNTKAKRAFLKGIIDPANHSWENDCLYNEVAPISVKTDRSSFAFKKEELREMNYDISIAASGGVVNVDVTFDAPPTPLKFVDTVVNVGESDD
jgi:hypothetical protein